VGQSNRSLATTCAPTGLPAAAIARLGRMGRYVGSVSTGTAEGTPPTPPVPTNSEEMVEVATTIDTVDVIVVGGGPAGAAAATILSRAGRRVLLVDKATFPRDKCCGDGLTTGALRRLQLLGLDPTTIPSWTWVDNVVLSTPHARAVRFPLPTNVGRFAAVATRFELDHALLRLASAAGTDVHESTALKHVTKDTDGLICVFEGRTGTTTVRAAHVVAADGIWSTTRKLIGTTPAAQAKRPYLGEWHGYRQYARNVHTEASRDLWVWFEPDLVPGYLWCFPLANGRVNVGFGIERQEDRPTKEMKMLWPELLARPHVRSVLGDSVEFEDSPKAWPIPANVTEAELAIGRVLFVGDAARSCDVLTGEGIGQALQTGIAAAESIAEAQRGSTRSAGEVYMHRVLAELGPDHRMASALQTAMSNRLVAEAAIRISGVSGWTRRNFARWLFEDYPRGIALTPARWRWGLMSGTGTYSGDE
jgi:menaquinone-9 beta-reductase